MDSIEIYFVIFYVKREKKPEGITGKRERGRPLENEHTQENEKKRKTNRDIGKRM